MKDARIWRHIFVTEQGVTHLLEVHAGKATLSAAQPIVGGKALPDALIFDWSLGDLRAFLRMGEEVMDLMDGK